MMSIAPCCPRSKLNRVNLTNSSDQPLYLFRLLLFLSPLPLSLPLSLSLSPIVKSVVDYEFMDNRLGLRDWGKIISYAPTGW